MIILFENFTWKKPCNKSASQCAMSQKFSLVSDGINETSYGFESFGPKQFHDAHHYL